MNDSLFGVERRTQIMELLRIEGRVTVKVLAARFTVTEDAIRKDLRQLEAAGQLQRTYGGAVLPTAVSGFVPYSRRGELPGKRSIARKAVELIRPGETVFMESSSHTTLMFEELGELPGVTVVTNSIHRLADLARKVNVIHIGGEVHGQDEACYGDVALQAIRSFNYDLCFLRTSGVAPDGTVTTSLPESLAVKKEALTRAKRSVLLAAADDWNRADTYNVCHISELGAVVTDSRDAAVLSFLERQAVRIEPASAAT